MDRSVDSIGSCSLDVDADSTDISDTSGSLNFPTPISVKDVTREFTTNIRERCTVHALYETEKDSEGYEVQMVLKQPTGSTSTSSTLINHAITNINSHLPDANLEKKPSYLNLACCVNGYSNLTTYDSKIRQNINRSREVSPIRPSSNSIQYCKKNNSLAPPVLLSMATESDNKQDPQRKPTNHNCGSGNILEASNTTRLGECVSQDKDERRSISFIQQRVERLYGPAALAQGFYSPKKVRSGSYTHTVLHETKNVPTSELARKFQQLTPSKDYSEFRKKLNATTSGSTRQVFSSSDISSLSNNTVDLPVLRHLSQEFRAQLPIISPKKNNLNITSVESTDKKPEMIDEVDHKVYLKPTDEFVGRHSTNGDITKNVLPEKPVNEEPVEKDGLYFMSLLKNEQNRLLALANDAEKYIEVLSKNPNVSEDILGLLRSASGKARLLVSQKMKQFEGLCQNNLKSSPEDKFPTTVDDLQGFWDMVHLQVDHINLIFSEIEILKENDWKKIENVTAPSKVNKPQLKLNKTVNQKAKIDTSKGNESTSSTMSAAALKRESQRKMLQEMKRKNKMALTAKSTTSDPKTIESKPENLSTVEIYIRNNNCSVSE